MRRRRPVGRKIYSVSYLLDKQPKTLRKQKHYQLMISYLQNAPELTGVRFNKRCYSLLNDAVIKPEHLDNFYRTYKLPRNPFFPLFFMLKRNYLMERAVKKLERSQYIESQIDRLPSYLNRYFILIRELELQYNRAGQAPIFKQNLSPKTKKMADSFAQNSHSDWIHFFGSYMKQMSTCYERISPETIERVSAFLILNCIPSSFKDIPDKSLVNNRYRNFSKIYHPDRGGDPEVFIKIKWARDILIHL